MKYYVLVIFIITQQNNVFGSNPKGRSVTAWSDICQRFPSFNGCRGQSNDVPPESGGQQEKIRPTHDLGHLEYCAKYKAHFRFYCNGSIEDKVIQFFCQSYRSKCSDNANNPVSLVQPPAVSGKEEDDKAPPTWGEIVDYCQKNKLAYSKLCFTNHIRQDAEVFCKGYGKICPGTPDPALAVAGEPPSDSDNKASYSKDLQLVTFSQINGYCNDFKGSYWKFCMHNLIRVEAEAFCKSYIDICPGAPDPRLTYLSTSVSGSAAQLSPHAQEVNSQKVDLQPNSPQSSRHPLPPPSPPASSQKASSSPANTGNFPWNDGNLADILGISSGGGGPLEGFGNMQNNMQLPFFGGPQKGGIGIGDGFMAPFFGMNKGTNVIPTKSVTTGQGYNIAGMKVGGYSNVDWSGTPGLGALNNAMGLGDGPSPPMGGGLGGIIPGLGGLGKKKRK